MPIKYVPSGDKFKASQLWGEGRHQLSILKNLMSFQDLKQDQRTVRFEDGAIIKCLSCFGQDVVEVFVPQVVGGVPKYRERIEIECYPAIEAYDSGAHFMGIVLCKGGGFNPPYEYVPKKDYLPTDYHDCPSEELPKERSWVAFGADGMVNYRDIVPSGLASPDFQQKPIEESYSRTGGFVDLVTNCKQQWDLGGPVLPEHWRYGARTLPHYQYDQSSSVKDAYELFVTLPDGAGECSLGASFIEHYLETTLEYAWNFLELTPTVSTEIIQHAVSQVCDPHCHWIRDDSVADCDTATMASEATIDDTEVNAIESDYSNSVETPSFVTGMNIFSGSSITKKISSSYKGSVLYEHHYAFAYSEYRTERISTDQSTAPGLEECIDLSWTEYEPPDSCIGSNLEVTTTEFGGPLNVVVNDVVFEIAPETSKLSSPRLRNATVKYFKLGEENGKSIGTFFISKNYQAPYDYMYVYVEVSEEKEEMIITEVDGAVHLLPGVKGSKDGEEIDLFGRGDPRLVCKRVTIKEMSTAKHPDVFRKIII